MFNTKNFLMIAFALIGLVLLYLGLVNKNGNEFISGFSLLGLVGVLEFVQAKINFNKDGKKERF